MKLGKIFGILLLVIFALSSCASTARVTKEPTEFELVAAEITTLQLPRGDVWKRDFVADAGTWKINPGSAAIAMLTFETWFQFSEKFDEESVRNIAKALFGNLVRHTKPKDMRAVVVGGVYGDNSNLIVLINQFQLKEGAVGAYTQGISFSTNSSRYKTEDKATGATSLLGTGFKIGAPSNIVYPAVPLEDGHLVLARNINNGKKVYDPSLSPSEKGNLMDTFIKDEDPANDAYIERLHREILETSVSTSIEKLLAHLNLGLYFLKLGDLQRADVAWAAAEAFLSPDMHPSVANVFANDIPFLRTAYRALTSK